MKRPKVISLFTGAGGLDLGLEAAGFELAVGVEFDPEAVATLRANRNWPIIDRDIHEVPTKELLEVAGLREGEADLLAGGPPCQPFSKSGYWASGDAGRLEDPRATTLEAFLRVLRDTKPKVFLLENVSGLAYRNKNEGLELLRTTIDEINEAAGTAYSFQSSVINTVEYGVPQERERFLVIGHRDGACFEFPKPTHTKPKKQRGTRRSSSEDKDLEPFHTAWDAIGDLQEDGSAELRMTGKWADLLPSIPEGENYLYHTDRGAGLPLFGWRRRYWSFLLKLSKRLPSWTITAQPGSAIGPFHWKNRRISMKELCRLQTFPDDYEILGGRTSYQKQLGNAVPAALAEKLGLEIRKMLGHDVRRRKLKLLPARRTPVPPAERSRKVPQKYMELVGEHEAHPGTGKGYGALARTQNQS
jgi:DNA (cytosine-5)-methyltransferase 1